jgi:Domain of unknown function (DUF4779)
LGQIGQRKLTQGREIRLTRIELLAQICANRESSHLGHDGAEGGSKKSHYDEADSHKEHHESSHKKKAGKHGHKKHHKKGSKTTGYHKKANKDEYHKEHKFYDDKHEEGKHKVRATFPVAQLLSQQNRFSCPFTRNTAATMLTITPTRANIRREDTTRLDTKKPVRSMRQSRVIEILNR